MKFFLALFLAVAAPAWGAPVQVSPEWFGMHTSAATLQPWPTTPFKSLRVWDQWPGVGWDAINTAHGQYNWAQLDALTAVARTNGVDILYTLGGRVPRWASAKPNQTGCQVGPGSCAPPTLAAWRAFVTAITARYRGIIQYWELWNEPNASNWWQGTDLQMVTLARVAYPIIRNADATNRVLSPSPQGANAHLWLDGYARAGGGAYSDIVSFHGYKGAPETIVSIVHKIKAIKGLAKKPLWDTEHSWGDQTWPFGANDDQEAAWTARFLAISISSGMIQRSYWYIYHGYEGQNNYGWLYNSTTGVLRKPGVAYEQVHRWLVGSTMYPCARRGAQFYLCRVTRPGGYEGKMVWVGSPSPGVTALFGVGRPYKRYRTLDGAVTAIPPGRTLTLGMKPILLEN